MYIVHLTLDNCFNAFSNNLIQIQSISNYRLTLKRERARQCHTATASASVFNLGSSALVEIRTNANTHGLLLSTMGKTLSKQYSNKITTTVTL